MAVDAAVELAFGVVQVHAAQVVETDDVAKLLKSALALFFGTQIVPGGEGVAGVDANADAALVFHAVDDRRQMFEFEARVAATAGGVSITAVTPAVLSSAMLIDSAMRAGHLSSSICSRWLPGWKFSSVSPSCSQRCNSSINASRDFSNASATGWRVDQVAVVRQDLPRPEAILRAGALELIDHVGGQRRGLPLTLIFGEQGERGRLQFVRADNRLIHAA